MEKMRLNIRFHDPNPKKDTCKLVSEVFADIWADRIKQELTETENNKKSPALKTSTGCLKSCRDLKD